MDSHVELIIERTQKYLENIPTMIIGSGFSVPFGLPTMSKLANQLKGELSSKYEGDDGWVNFINLLDKGYDLESALLEVSLKEDITKEIIKVTWSMVNSLDREAFLKFVQDAQNNGLRNIFNTLLQSHPRRVDVITTNYDRLIEYSADKVNANIQMGFKGEYIKRLDKIDTQTKPNQKSIVLCKVHGSLDWFKKENGHQIMSLPNSDNILSDFQPVIVTPGIHKYQETHNEPFRTMINAADTLISEATSFLCIGYGFNDDHLHPKLINQIDSLEKEIVIVTKELTEGGRELIKSAKKFIVFEEASQGGTKITSHDGVINAKENFWKIDEFAKMWL